MKTDRSGMWQKLQAIRRLAAENCLSWTACFLCYITIRRIIKDCKIPALDKYMHRLEVKHNLPGINSVAINHLIWQNWNWSREGEEWTKSSESRQSIIDDILLKYVAPGKTVLEIGPGAGKWTESLQAVSNELSVVDLSENCIEICKKKFSHCDNIKYFVTDGTSLEFIPDETIDYIWSFDVFVHIHPQDIEKYITEFNRVLKSGGRGIIHHAKNGRFHGGWRSNMTGELFAEMVRQNGLTLITQFDSWGENNQFNVRHYHDTISVFEK